MIGKKGDIVHKLFLSCGHMDIDIQENAAQKPMWMLYEIKVGSTGKCPHCGKQVEVTKTERIRGWGDS